MSILPQTSEWYLVDIKSISRHLNLGDNAISFVAVLVMLYNGVARLFIDLLLWRNNVFIWKISDENVWTRQLAYVFPSPKIHLVHERLMQTLL